jgi:integrase/recombinase XerC/integrase/recombinase XerD
MKKSGALTVSKTAIVRTTPTISELIAQFIASQDVRTSSKGLYGRTLKQYFNWLHGSGIQIQDVTRVEILRYKQEILDNGLSPLTVGSYLTVVRKFYEWAEGNKYYPNVAKGIKTPHRRQQFRKQALTQTQSTALLEYYQSRAKRDYAIVNLLLRTGLRTIETIRANVDDITFKAGKRVLLVHGKGRDEKDNFVILTDKANQSIADYLHTRGRVKSGEPLFISTSNNSKGDRLTTRTISYIAKEGLKAIGLDGKEFTAHSLRHTTAVNILRQGGTIEDAQGVLRHSSPATTQIYTATIKEELRLKHAPEELLDSVY